MADVYAAITEAEPAVLEQLVGILELRAADPRQREMREEYLAHVPFPAEARVTEVGCGTGAVARSLASRPGVGEVVGVDPSPVFLDRARELARELPSLSFVEGDARMLPFDDGTFDVVVFHTTLCHVPGPELALAEAFRVLREDASLAVFDGDYVTTTCALGDFDPLEACADAAVDALVLDRWFARKLPSLVRAVGFDELRIGGHSYVEAPTSGGYMLALADRGADALADAGRVSAEAADALKAEARRRSDEGEFFGHIAYVSIVARRPATA